MDRSYTKEPVSYVEDMVRGTLANLPSEYSRFDYKEAVYLDSKLHEFLKDICAMLNSRVGIYQDKVILVGVEDKTKRRIGLQGHPWRDDNEWQNLLKKIKPYPDVSTGVLKYEGNEYGYFYIHACNNEWIYEICETYAGNPKEEIKTKNAVFAGQAFTRKGSTNQILYHSDRQRLLSAIKQESLQSLYSSITLIDSRSIQIACMIGAWNEANEGDVDFIQKVYGGEYDAFVADIRKSYSEEASLFSFHNGVWKCINHRRAICGVANHIFDDLIDALFTKLQPALQCVDEKYSLPSAQRIFVGALERKTQLAYSPALRKGLIEMIAICGNHEKEFCNCSSNKLYGEIRKIERAVFSAKDWKVYASLADYFPLLGEAFPEVFLDELSSLLNNSDDAFLAFLSESETGISTIKYGYQLGWVLRLLASQSAFFAKSMQVLFRLAIIREDFIDEMVGVILPWYPQTNALPQSRIGVVKGLVKIDDNVGWNLLMKLMPGATTSVFPVIESSYLATDSIKEGVTLKEYWEDTEGYVLVALSLLNAQEKRLIEMIDVVDDIHDSLREIVLNKIVAETKQLHSDSKNRIWKKAQNLILKHKKFSDAKWALPEAKLDYIKTKIDEIPENLERAHIERLFQNDQWELLEETDNYEEESQKLTYKQEEVLRRIHADSGIEGLLELERSVENKELYGRMIVSYLGAEDISTIIDEQGVDNNAFLKGIVLTGDLDVLQEAIQDYSEEEQAKIIALKPVSEKTIAFISGFNESAASTFWSSVDIWGSGKSAEESISIVGNLNRSRRFIDSIQLLHDGIVFRNQDIPPQIVVSTLLELDDLSNGRQNSYYCVQELIKWLQNSKYDDKEMSQIEWKYLSILNSVDGCEPKCLLEKLTNDPEFFIDVLEKTYGRKPNSNETDHALVARKCYKLLTEWKTIPGITSENSLDADKMKEWLEAVGTEGKKKGLYDRAMFYYGKVSFYSPPDTDGFFINRKVVDELDEIGSASARNGYQIEAYNSRGVHFVDFTGRDEFALEEAYNDKAQKAEQEGYINFSEALRSIAKTYHKEALRSVEEGNQINSFEI